MATLTNAEKAEKIKDNADNRSGGGGNNELVDTDSLLVWVDARARSGSC